MDPLERGGRVFRGVVGISIEHGKQDRGTVLRFETRGRTEIASVDADGALEARERANVGIEGGDRNRFRLLLRRSMLEFHLDESLVQFHSLAETPTPIVDNGAFEC